MKAKKKITPSAEDLQALFDGSGVPFMPEVFEDKNLKAIVSQADKPSVISVPSCVANEQPAELPDPPLSFRDLPTQPCAVITQTEIVALANAAHTFQIARADYEMKRAAIALKLLLCAEPEAGSYEVELNQKRGLILTDRTSIPLERIIIGEGDSRPALFD